MELSKNYDPSAVDAKWYAHWISKNYFHSAPDSREPYTIAIPPPNVTGVLHMGHALNNTIQDILIRHARMTGKNACWVPGTDHASIATEAKVVGMLRERGINKATLTREEFLEYAWEWKEKYGGIILQQLKKLGCSCDWERTTFTMDPHYYATVISVFVDLYEKGLIYRGKRMIHWDPKAKTALSDEEVLYKEVKSKLFFVKYSIDGGGSITIATTRPETILGDTAIAVNPNDPRFKDYHGKFAFVPLINRRIPVITDDYVAMDFGTGALKVTPAHDMNDYVLGEKHKLEVVDILNEDGTLNESAQLFTGLDRFEARKQIAIELQEKGFIEKIEEYTNQLGFSERTDAVVEPRLSLQWWVSMKNLAAPALEAVLEDDIQFHPAKFRNLYRNWMENIRDWCISRQLWWGQRVPAWYDDKGNYAVAKTQEEAIAKLKSKNPALEERTVKQDEDVLDTWFSSWLWPIEVFKGLSNPGNNDINYYYPTSTLVTAPEIIFFWVARMIMSGFEYKKEKPFSDVYFTGIVRDKLGRKMSKQLGNSPDLLGLIDQYGADAVRFGIMISSPAGNDLLFDESALEQGRNFNNKLWNAMKLVKMWESRTVNETNTSDIDQIAIDWFTNQLNQATSEIAEDIKQFRLSEALKKLYSLVWDDFCSWYLEMVKPEFINGEAQPMNRITFNRTLEFFDILLQWLHPYMPFISEEIWHTLRERKEDLVVSRLAIAEPFDQKLITEFENVKEHISLIRNFRKQKNIPQKEKITLLGRSETSSMRFDPLVKKLGNIGDLQYGVEKPANAITFVSLLTEFYIPVATQVDRHAERQRLEQELEYNKKFLLSVENKLSNERFVANARPDVLEKERKKKSDTEEKIKSLEDNLRNI